MHVPMMVRTASLTFLAGFLVACAEAPTGATGPRSEGLRPPFDAAATGASLLLGAGDQRELTITVDPNTTRYYQLGESWVYIPRGAVCRLDSSYGVSEWDKDCVSETQTFSIPVTVGQRNGHALIVFGRDMRFKPTNDPLQAVYLYLREPSLVQGNFGVLWQGADGQWIDEAATDPTLRAFRVQGVWVGRRVKHFSGYNVSLGFSEQRDPTIYGFGR